MTNDLYLNKTVLTGIKPTGTPHLGNLVGAIQPVIDMSNLASQSFIFIADLHSLNTMRDFHSVQRYSVEIAATFMAFGLNLGKARLFRQSDVPEVYQLTVLLTNVTSKGLMNRAHAYKAAVDRNKNAAVDLDAGINMGLYVYPILMAADILLYKTDLVPVGQDQRQHVEMSRDIAESFNRIYGEGILTVPDPVIEDKVSTIPGIDGRKMSKSYDNYIPIFASPDELRKVVAKIVTDSKRPEEPKDPESSTIFQLFQSFGSVGEIDELRNKFLAGGLGYGDAKAKLCTVLTRSLKEPREKYLELMAKPSSIEEVLKDGANKARVSARTTLESVTSAMLGRSCGP